MLHMSIAVYSGVLVHISYTLHTPTVLLLYMDTKKKHMQIYMHCDDSKLVLSSCPLLVLSRCVPLHRIEIEVLQVKLFAYNRFES